jgi:hypothetical protein
MMVEVSRQYREGSWSIYNESINDWWDEYLSILDESFDSDNAEHLESATAFIQSKYGNDVKVRLLVG